jgi:hypothetical protein
VLLLQTCPALPADVQFGAPGVFAPADGQVRGTVTPQVQCWGVLMRRATQVILLASTGGSGDDVPFGRLMSGGPQLDDTCDMGSVTARIRMIACICLCRPAATVTSSNRQGPLGAAIVEVRRGATPRMNAACR